MVDIIHFTSVYSLLSQNKNIPLESNFDFSLNFLVLSIRGIPGIPKKNSNRSTSQKQIFLRYMQKFPSMT